MLFMLSKFGETRHQIDVIYAAKQYWILTKRTIVIETNEAEFIISINREVPDYVPYVAKRSV